MSRETIKELAVWTTAMMVCGSVPFVVEIMIRGGKLGFLSTILDALK